MNTTSSSYVANREEAWALLCEYTEKEGLRNHGLAVEAAMRGYARYFEISAEEEEIWAITGLLHDFDYERWPDPEDHPYKGVAILAEKGYPEEMRDAIMGHASYTGTPRTTLLSRCLFACDELSGFMVATALIKANKTLAEVDLKSVKKRLKSKSFARGVDREEVRQGAAELERELDDHILTVLASLQAASKELGL